MCKEDLKKYEEILENDGYIREEDLDPEVLQQLLDEGILEEVDGEDLDNYCDEDEDLSTQEKMDILSIEEELRRRELQENPTSTVSEGTKNTDLYKENMAKVETIGAMIQKLIGFGMDYSNAVTVAMSLIKDGHELKLAKISTMV